MNTARWIVIIVLILALSIPSTPVRAAQPALGCAAAVVALSAPTPSPGVVGGDISFTVVFSVTGCAPAVAGAEVFLGYDYTLVEPPASPLGVAVPLPDFFGTSNVTIAELLSDDPRCPGYHACVHLVAAGPAQADQSGAAARFHFRGKATGTACFKILGAKLVDGDGFDVPNIIGAPNPSCDDIIFLATVKGKVLRQGVPPSSGGGTWACSEVWSTSGAVKYGPVFTNTAGDFVLPDLPPGLHTLHAKYSGYLTSETTFTVVVSVGTTVPPILVGTTTLRGGDTNDISDTGGDGKINILDVGEILSEFASIGASVGSSLPIDCSKPDDSADINDDGNININDLAIAAGNWACISPTPWVPTPPTRCIP